MALCFPSICKYQMIQIILYFLILFLMPCYGDVDAGSDTLLQARQLRDGEYLSSANNIFRLRFFRPGNSKSKYLGIFSTGDDSNPVWVGNRDAPVPDLFVMLMIDSTDGLLKISYHGGNTIVSNSSSSSGKNTSATILDNGNLVLRMMNPDGSTNRTLWQSFDYPTDTLLPGMKLGINFKTGHKWSLTSWTSNDVPGSGSFTLGGDPNGSTQLVLWWQGNVYWTSGLWDKAYFKDTYYLSDRLDLSFSYVANEKEKYLIFSKLDNISLAKVRIDFKGFTEVTQRYEDGSSTGSYSERCSLSAGRVNLGCVMDMRPKCRNAGLEFRGKRGSTVGYGYGYDDNQKLSLFDCEVKCRQNCSCIAFASVYNNGTGCEIFNKDIWFLPSESKDAPFYPKDETIIYFLDTGRAAQWWIWLIAAAGGTFLLLTILCCVIRIKRKRKDQKQAKEMLLHELADTDITPGKKMNHVHLFSFESLEAATNKFSTETKLGEGGFGSVYKGKLPSGKEIAIKRLSRSSGQGVQEFKNEILLIAKLQHDNLVRILGCCMKGEEKILVYEYMPNKSLDFFLFDPSRRELLGWANRMNIIEGVAQGLIYLHKYSRLKVIHRDLKASNILLDRNMNPKISDFGMARIFGKQDSEANTNRIVGTHGYMSPEYAIKGVFSVKSDVFSFGVLLLEIVSGKKNRGCYNSERPLNLIGLAWELWIEGRATELIDPAVLDESNHKAAQIICRFINVGLLCVQDNANDRPSMPDVITMLTNESFRLPEPKQPAFFIESSSRKGDQEVDAENPCTNSLSISVMEGR